MMTLSEPSIILPSPPQCLVLSPLRTAGLPLMKTVEEPSAALHMFGPQQTA
jgi:hypothetical protein